MTTQIKKDLGSSVFIILNFMLRIYKVRLIGSLISINILKMKQAHKIFTVYCKITYFHGVKFSWFTRICWLVGILISGLIKVALMQFLNFIFQEGTQYNLIQQEN
jgi:hypothetical protein